MSSARIDGARFGSIDQAMAFAMQRAVDACDAYGVEARIISIADGLHADGSSHYRDCAFDLGLVHVTAGNRQNIVDHLVNSLDANTLEGRKPNSDFLVIYGDEGHQTGAHIQFKPQKGMNIP